jgi:hypothetical protein
MANLAEEDQKLLSSLLSGSTAGLTIKELESFDKKDITTYAQKMGYTGEDGMARMVEALRY